MCLCVVQSQQRHQFGRKGSSETIDEMEMMASLEYSNYATKNKKEHRILRSSFLSVSQSHSLIPFLLLDESLFYDSHKLNLLKRITARKLCTLFPYRRILHRFMGNFPSNTLNKWIRFDNNDNVNGDNEEVKTQVFVSMM